MKKCECGRTSAAEPLEMCESCPVCDVMMHSADDKAVHAGCAAVAVEIEPEPAAKSRSRKKVPVAAVPLRSGAERAWPVFFARQRHPVTRSQLVTSLMRGTVLESARVPVHALLDVVLLAAACREYHDAEVVDDFQGLLDRAEEQWRRPDWTCRTFDQTHANWANFIINFARRDFETPETGYVPALAGWFLGHDMPEYFSREVTK